ncbi:hypothetical protein M9H77_17868 [Catharanthus roseus]|uniref:Uncharacterized protein n=1 Tax=Catharanthus roseus TaxID=4058 RepID=A0ACC0B5T1_CATRO|nr:hypothetical protein M9H77_17868 [Catharanthus roseus]
MDFVGHKALGENSDDLQCINYTKSECEVLVRRLSKHYAQVDYRQKLVKFSRPRQMAFLFTNTNKKPHSDQSVNSGYDLLFGSIRGLHYTWLVPRTRASTDGVDISDSGEWIHLKRRVDCRGCGPIGLREHRIILCSGVRPPSGVRKGSTPRLTQDGDTINCGSFRHGVLVQVSPEGHVSPFYSLVLEPFIYGLVPRGTQIPYLAVADLVARFGVSHYVSTPDVFIMLCRLRLVFLAWLQLFLRKF